MFVVLYLVICSVLSRIDSVTLNAQLMELKLFFLFSAKYVLRCVILLFNCLFAIIFSHILDFKFVHTDSHENLSYSMNKQPTKFPTTVQSKRC